jgi:antitoxin (DNA-binding transcriptional repressor) of toxin-antitoxin stability system
MKFVTLRDLKINPSQVLDGLGKHDVVVIRKGKPAAAVIYLDEDMLDDYVLAHHPGLLREVKAARAEYMKAGGIDHATMKKRVSRRG